MRNTQTFNGKNLIGGQIRTLRLKKKLTQSAIADAAGVDRTTVVRWEQGIGNIPDSALPSIASLLDVTISMLFAEVVR
jgi:transcriptional regulator with XRE-family HTH domain